MTFSLRFEEWMDQAECRDLNFAQIDALFFPETGSRRSDEEQARLTRGGKRYCARCPVRKECLTTALKNDEEWGIYGGWTPRERRAGRARGLSIPERVALLEKEFEETKYVRGLVTKKEAS